MRVILMRQALLYSAAGVLFWTGTLHAGLVTTVNGTGNFSDLSQSFGCSDTGTTSASCSFMRGDAFLNASGSYQADAEYGSLDVTSMSDSFGRADAFGTSSASFADTFLLTGGVGSGTLVFLTEYRGLTQSESCPPFCSNATVTLNTFTVKPIGPTITNLSFSFTFGALFNLNGSASAFSTAVGAEEAMTTAHLKIDSIQVLNSDGAPITNFAVTTGSGANYPFVVPEPGNFAPVIFVLTALVALRPKYLRNHRLMRARTGCAHIFADPFCQ
jgi:hypothetical protein